jgi:tRNA A64-2'-O-ribosylphosphate transferase
MMEGDSLDLSGSSWSLEDSLREISETAASSNRRCCQSIRLTSFDVDTTLAAKLVNILSNKSHRVKNLQFIECTGHIEIVVAVALTSTALESLTITLGNLSSAALDPVAHSIGVGLQTANSNLHTLVLKSASNVFFTLSTAAAFSLQEGLSASNSLECFYMEGCRFAERNAVQALARGLGGLSSLRDVRLTSCFAHNGHPLDDDSIALLIHGIEHNPKLERLNLTGNKCLDRGVAALATLLDRTKIQHLDLSCQCIDEDESMNFSLLVGALGRTSTLQSLELKFNKLSSDRDMAFLAAALMHNTSIKSIGLASNKITNSGLEILASRVPSMQVLRRLALNNNAFDNQGATLLAQAMKENFTISHVICEKSLQSYRDIRYYADLNWCGRMFVKKFASYKPSLWPLILGRATALLGDHISCTQQRQADTIFFLMRQGTPPLQSSQTKWITPPAICSTPGSRQKKKTATRARHRLLSIARDAQIIEKQLMTLPGKLRDLPLIPNERCGRWYLNEFRTSCYFKSTDGHVNIWEFSLKRLNLELLHGVIAKEGGCVIVDSSVRKRLPDSFSRTIPIWATVLNRIVKKYADELGISIVDYRTWDTRFHTPKSIVSKEEHDKMVSLIDARVETLYRSRAIVDPESLVRALTKPLKVVWLNHRGEMYPSNVCVDANAMTSDLDLDDFFLVTCWNPSQYKSQDYKAKKSHIEWIDCPGYFYTPGAADDHESWAHQLTPRLFWEHHATLLRPYQSDDQVDRQIHDIVWREKSNALNAAQDDIRQPAISCDRIGSLNLWVGSRRAGKPPQCWDSFDAILNVTNESYFGHGLPQKSSKFYLQLPVEEGKRDKTELEKWMPVGLVFVIFHLQRGHRILVHCAQGKDRSVAVVIIFICLACELIHPLQLRPDFLSWDLALLRCSLVAERTKSSCDANSVDYAESGLPSELVSSLLLEESRDKLLFWAHGILQRDIADGPLFDKENIRIALHLIRQDREVAEPTRSTMQKINRFLMSSKLYQNGM